MMPERDHESNDTWRIKLLTLISISFVISGLAVTVVILQWPRQSRPIHVWTPETLPIPSRPALVATAVKQNGRQRYDCSTHTDWPFRAFSAADLQSYPDKLNRTALLDAVATLEGRKESAWVVLLKDNQLYARPLATQQQTDLDEQRSTIPHYILPLVRAVCHGSTWPGAHGDRHLPALVITHACAWCCMCTGAIPPTAGSMLLCHTAHACHAMPPAPRAVCNH
jgi:hypothetical protein